MLAPALTARYRDNFFAVSNDSDCPMEETANSLSNITVKPVGRATKACFLETHLYFTTGKSVRCTLIGKESRGCSVLAASIWSTCKDVTAMIINGHDVQNSLLLWTEYWGFYRNGPSYLWILENPQVPKTMVATTVGCGIGKGGGSSVVFATTTQNRTLTGQPNDGPQKIQWIFWLLTYWLEKL